VELLAQFIDIVLHLDTHLVSMVERYGVWIYAILFAIIFSETGFVVTPILPGDSLLFVAGAVAATGGMNVHIVVVLLVAAAFLGNTVNYAIGRWLGTRFFTDRKSRWLNPAHMEKAHAFYERHGGKAVVISRFLPIVRTYIPFVAGMAAMDARALHGLQRRGRRAVGGLAHYAGFFFGNIPWIKGNLTAIIVGIIAVSLLPLVIAFARSRLRRPERGHARVARVRDLQRDPGHRSRRSSCSPPSAPSSTLISRLARAVDRRAHVEERVPEYLARAATRRCAELRYSRRIRLVLWSIGSRCSRRLLVCLADRHRVLRRLRLARSLPARWRSSSSRR
jgi:membrane-associated protein